MKISVRKSKAKYSEFGTKYIKKVLNRKYRKYNFVKNVDVEVRRFNDGLISYLMNIYVENNSNPITIAYTTSNERDALIGALNVTQAQLNQIKRYKANNQEVQE